MSSQPPTPEPARVETSVDIPDFNISPKSQTNTLPNDGTTSPNFVAIPITPATPRTTSPRSHSTPSPTLSRLSSYLVQPLEPTPDFPATKFVSLVDNVRAAIQSGIEPTIIYQGSSGSYFCKDASNAVVAVFKPKDEEPYGNLNPKWIKYLHRTFLPCCFGRSSLIPNVGYISEASASLVDRELNLGLVPRTEIVKLASSAFNYAKHHRNSTKPLPLKVGSFQLFLKGYSNADQFFQTYPWPNPSVLDKYTDFDLEIPDVIEDINTHAIDDTVPILSMDANSQAHPFWTTKRQLNFRLELEKLVILDYLIRNTDRGLDNWMIKALPDHVIKIAAIDHGLAFPHQHPSNFRMYPYGWLALPTSLIGPPFSTSIRHYMLSRLTSQAFWSLFELKMHRMMQLDEDFNHKMYHKQISIVRGQAYNLIECLKDPTKGPIQLFQMIPKLVLDEEEDESQGPSQAYPLSPSESPLYETLADLGSYPDPFFDQKVANDIPAVKKVFKKLKHFTKKPMFTFC